MNTLIYLNKPLKTKLRPAPKGMVTLPRSRFAAPIPAISHPLPPDPGVSPGMLHEVTEISFVKLYKECVDTLQNEKLLHRNTPRKQRSGTSIKCYEENSKMYKQVYPDIQVMRCGVPKVDVMLELDYTVNKY